MSRKRGTSLKKEYHQRNAKIIETNSKEDVKKISSRAFQKYCNQKGNDLEDRGKRSKKGKVEINSQERDEEEGGEASVDDALKAMGILENLKGVARARSSLLLSVAFRRTVPYLSRALYRWMNWDDETGWTQACTWTSGTKKQLLVKVRDMAKKFDVGAVDVEKVAFVLECEGRIAGKQAMPLCRSTIDTMSGRFKEREYHEGAREECRSTRNRRTRNSLPSPCGNGTGVRKWDRRNQEDTQRNITC